MTRALLRVFFSETIVPGERGFVAHLIRRKFGDAVSPSETWTAEFGFHAHCAVPLAIKKGPYL
jgi:hypothetical protein